MKKRKRNPLARDVSEFYKESESVDLHANGGSIVFEDDGPDAYGRRHFSAYWEDRDGPFRPEISSNGDGKPVGYRRAQCFHARPEQYREFFKGMKIYDRAAKP